MKTASGREWGATESVSCAVCERDGTELVFYGRDFIYGNEGVFAIVRCRDCGLVYINPRPRPEEAPKFYPSTYFSFQPPRVPSPSPRLHARLRRAAKAVVLQEAFSYPPPADPIPPILRRRVSRRVLAALFRRYIEHIRVPPFLGHHRLLDVGCGNGSFLLAMKALGWDTYGVELNPTSAAFARERLGLRVVSGTLEAAVFDDAFFDVITFWDSLEHLPNPVEALSAARRILSPTGLLIINTPNFNCVPQRLFREKWFNVAAPLHYYLYTLDSLGRLLQKVGFRIERVRYPWGTAGLKQSMEILLLGRIHSNGSRAKTLVHGLFHIPHRLTPRGHLLVYAQKA